MKDFIKTIGYAILTLSLFFTDVTSVFGQQDTAATGAGGITMPVEPIPLPIGADTDLWRFTNPAQHHNSIVQVTSGEGVGTGVLVSVNKSKRVKNGYQGYVVTAWHVVKNDEDKGEVSILYRNGRKAKDCQVVAKDEAGDIAIIWVWIPDGIEAATIAGTEVSGGDSLEFAGLGGGSELSTGLRHFEAQASSPSSQKKIFADVPLLPGDSGGPVFNADHELVGVISGGWFWFDGGVKTRYGNTISTTWPARAANLEPIKVLIAELETPEAEFDMLDPTITR